MMKLKVFGIDIMLSYSFVAFFSLALIYDKRCTVIFCLLSSLLHEAGHLTVIKLFNVRISMIKLSLGDVSINTEGSELSTAKDLLINLGGIAVNGILAVIFVFLYLLSGASLLFDFCVINIFIGLFNALPIRYLDGGQLLYLFLCRKLSPKTIDRILNITTFIFIIPVGILGFLSIFNSSYNYSLLFAVVYLICTLVSKELR